MCASSCLPLNVNICYRDRYGAGEAEYTKYPIWAKFILEMTIYINEKDEKSIGIN